MCYIVGVIRDDFISSISGRSVVLLPFPSCSFVWLRASFDPWKEQHNYVFEKVKVK
jgi:hypothetical protein